MLERLSLRNSLARKLVLAFLAIGAAMALAAFTIATNLILPAFINFEREQSLASLDRVETTMQGQLDRLLGASLEYSAWDDIYEYVQDPAAQPGHLDYLEDGNYWADIDIEIMMFFDRRGRLVWGRMIDPLDYREVPLSDVLPKMPGPGHPLLRHTGVDSRIQGLLDTRLGTLMVGSTPITHSDKSGPVMGSVVVGHLLTREVEEEMRQAASVDVSIYRISDSTMPEVTPLELEGQLAAGKRATTVRGEFDTRSRMVVEDLFGSPLIMVETRTPNQISAIGVRTITTALSFMLLVISLFVLTAWWILRCLVISPVLALREHIAKVRTSGDLSVPFASDRSDELGVLAAEFDALILELGETQRQRDDAESLSNAKTQFMMSISHEIRTPMNGVIGMTDALLRMDLPENSRRLLHRVKASGQILLNVINDILDFSRINEGQSLLDSERFSLRAMVADVNAAVADSAQRKGIEYICRLSPDLPDSAVGDQQRIKQVLINLIGNAIKFTHEGEVVLALGCAAGHKPEEGGETLLDFTISDTGIGIPAHSLGSIFDSFSQVDNGPDREYGGTGLGLAISKALIEAMGGEIDVASECGSGSRFHFTVPVSRVTQSPQAAEQSVELGGMGALVVDAHDGSRDLLTSLLEELGAEVDAADSGAQALAMLDTTYGEGRHYNLLLVDNKLGQTDELALAAAAKDDAGMATIVLCGVADDTADCCSHTCINKPVLREELAKAIQRASGDGSQPPGEPEQSGANQVAPYLPIDVLVVEDNEVNQELITFELTEIGARHVVANNGMEALNELARGAFDIVLMDCQMPVMDGFTATERIRAMNIADKRGHPVPILAMTASAGEDDQEHCLSVGMDAYISKPYKFEQLVECINKLLPAARQLEMVIDTASLDSIRELEQNRPGVLGRLIEVYLDTLPALIADIREAIAAGDPDTVRLHAHKLKSSSATLGASKVSSIAWELECLGRDGDLARCAEVFPNLLEALEQASSALEQEKGRSARPESTEVETVVVPD